MIIAGSDSSTSSTPERRRWSASSAWARNRISAASFVRVAFSCAVLRAIFQRALALRLTSDSTAAQSTPERNTAHRGSNVVREIVASSIAERAIAPAATRVCAIQRFNRAFVTGHSLLESDRSGRLATGSRGEAFRRIGESGAGAAPGVADVDQSALDGEDREPGDVADSKPLHQRGAMGLDGLRADLEGEGDLLGALALRDHLEDLALPRREAVQGGARAGGTTVHDPGDEVARRPGADVL